MLRPPLGTSPSLSQMSGSGGWAGSIHSPLAQGMSVKCFKSHRLVLRPPWGWRDVFITRALVLLLLPSPAPGSAASWTSLQI